MKNYFIRINFHWIDDDTQSFIIHVSDDVELNDIEDELDKAHKQHNLGDIIELCDPEDLLAYVCKENGWKYEKFSFDIDFTYSI